jgi:hypothetical protein
VVPLLTAPYLSLMLTPRRVVLRVSCRVVSCCMLCVVSRYYVCYSATPLPGVSPPLSFPWNTTAGYLHMLKTTQVDRRHLAAQRGETSPGGDDSTSEDAPNAPKTICLPMFSKIRLR